VSGTYLDDAFDGCGFGNLMVRGFE